MKEMFSNVFVMHHGIEILAIAYLITGLLVFTITLLFITEKVIENKIMEKQFKKWKEETKNEKRK